MIKKIVIATVAGTLVTGFFFGRDAASYVCTSAGQVRDSVRNSVPVEFEIERARKMVQNLVPDIRKNMHLIAKEEVEVERINEQIARAEEDQAKQKAELMTLQTDLKSGASVFQYAGRSYNKEQVKVDLSRRFNRYKTQDVTLASLREMRDAREQSLTAAQDKLQNMLAAKRELGVQLESLEAKLRMVEAKQAASDFAVDDSQLSRAKRLVSDLRTLLDVAERLVNSEGQIIDEIPLDEETPDDIVDQVTEYFTPAAEAPQATEAPQVASAEDLEPSGSL
ncbi:MAG: hypothetical protein KDA63_05900 [Planctomycetales bacterium]|nr:hypothetical protein [Planctomycetales bacterium]